MKIIEKIETTKGLKDNFVIKNKKVLKMVNEIDCIEHYYDGDSHVFITKEKYTVQGVKLSLIFRADKMKNGTYRIIQN